MELPQAFFVAAAAVLASLIAGFFSFVNLVSSKENKVSEFRLTWINGLRDDIALYTVAIQDLAKIENIRASLNDEDHSTESQEERERVWLSESRQAYADIIRSLSCIQLRLNPSHVQSKPESSEALLMQCVEEARTKFNSGDFAGASSCCPKIRSAAAPLLKATWDLVKRGEPEYQRIRKSAERIIMFGTTTVILVVFIAILFNR